MSVTGIKIKDFTVFKDFSLEPNSRINVIIGENGTGKTHLLKLIYAAALSRNKQVNEADAVFDFPPGFDYSVGIKIAGNNGSDSESASALIESSTEYMPIFIPAKEMPSISRFTNVADQFKKSMALDPTLTDVIRMGQHEIPDNPTALAQKLTPKLEKIIEGTVFIRHSDKTFWIRKHNGMEIPFWLEAEGIRKFALLWQLLMNHNLNEGDVLLWDEPEANINPLLIPELTDIIVELSQNNVQVFCATHSYMFAHYLDLRKKSTDNVSFVSLYKSDGVIKTSIADSYSSLQVNPIEASEQKLYEAVVEKALEDK